MKTETKSDWLAELLSILFIALVVAVANGLQLIYILFPELGALASDVLLRPNGKWAREPWKLVATPSLTASFGIVIGSRLPYGVFTILLTMSVSIAAVLALKSAVAPAISAGVLPIVLGVSSWLYPLCILCTLSVLTGILLFWRRLGPGKNLMANGGRVEQTIEVLESKPNGQWWFPTLFLFVAILGTIAQVTTWRFILFPPLIVMAYEMLGHPDTCPWAKPPFTFPAVCFLAALSGVEAKHWLHGTPLAASLVLIFTLALLRVARLRMPPALAIGLIPFVMPSPTVAYALSVAGGTLALTAWFMLYRRWPGSQPPSNPPHPGTTEPCRNVSQTRFPTLTC